MTKPITVAFCFLFLALTTQFLRQLCLLTGVPDIISLVREPLLFGLCAWGLMHVDFFRERRLAVAIVGLLALLSVYLFVAAFEARLFPGLYYVRLYLIPLLFFIGWHAALRNTDRPQLLSVLRVLALVNIAVLGVAFGVYALLQIDPTWIGKLIGQGKLATAWYISGGLYMRMGLPFISPNNIGTYSALMALLTSLLLFATTLRPGDRHLHWVSLIFSLAALAASLSRSAMLLLFSALMCFLLIPQLYHSRLFARLAGYAVALLALVIIALVAVEFISEGFLSRWIELNMAGKDPSMRGHIETFVEAYRDVDEYYLHGYPHGTVGPKAFQFSGRIHNAENSMLALFYDFGLIAGSLFLLLQLLLLSSVWHTRLQLPVIVGFTVNMQFLPIIFEPESIACFVFVYLLVAHMGRAGLFDQLQRAPAARPEGLTITGGTAPLRG